MIDGLLNLVVILIPLGIFIGRAVLMAKSRRERADAARNAPPTPVAQAQQDDEFDEEDGNEHLPHWLRAPRQQLQQLQQQLQQQQRAAAEVDADDDDDIPHWERSARQREKIAAAQEKQAVDEDFSLSPSFHEAASITPLAAASLEAPAAPVHATPAIGGALPSSYAAARAGGGAVASGALGGGAPAGGAGIQNQPVLAPSFAPPRPVNAAVPKKQGGFPNIAHLSHLKQAVIMAEILGPPKSNR
ncbi:MAG: hypothetical protein FWG66_15110 [Spirochaetes bacterium]|nr:hypothetical protein [Spirochaetota bacterium]